MHPPSNLLWILLLLVGCATGRHPVTDGFVRQLPPRPATMVVIGNVPIAESTSMGWLQEQGYRVVERSKVDKLLDEQSLQLKHGQEREAMIRVGRLAGAQFMVLVDASVNRSTKPALIFVPSYGSGGGGFFGGLAQGMAQGSASRAMREAGEWYEASVSIKAVSIETGEVTLSGSAYYPEPQRLLDPMMHNLTCHALATAFGLREPGHKRIDDESACHPSRSN